MKVLKSTILEMDINMPLALGLRQDLRHWY
jgi:hypothetical protein